MKKIKKLKMPLYVILFAAICMSTLSFLNLFTKNSSPILGYMSWDLGEMTGEDGTEAFDPLTASQQDWEEGSSVRLLGHLPDLDQAPALYDGTGYLMFGYDGLEIQVSIDGKERVCLSSEPSNADNYFLSILYVSLSPQDAGKEIVLQYTPLSGSAFEAPLFARFSSENAVNQAAYAFASHCTLPAGAYALAFILICAVFLLSLAIGSPDWSLPLLALAAALALTTNLNRILVYDLIPRWLREHLVTERVYLLLTVLMLLYLFLNRRRSFWRYLYRVTLCFIPAFAVWYGIDRLRGGLFSATADLALARLMEGDPRIVLYYLGIYFTTACAGIASYSLLRAQLRIRTQANTLALHNRLVMENYSQMEQSIRSTSLMRHEWKNQVTALRLLAAQKKYEELERSLEQMDSSLEHLSIQRYSGNFTVNVILQNVAARAESLGIKFHASAVLPEELNVTAGDLCSLLINMLDNALEAASRAPKDREVNFTIKISQGFLAIKCENTYSDLLPAEDSGQFQSTKPDPEHHGIGMTQMQNVVKKYGGILNVSYTEDRFTVQTALGSARRSS